MFYGNYAVEIPVGERKIFLKTKPCAPLQILQVLGSRYRTPIYTATGVFCRQSSRQLCYRFNA